MKCKALLFVVLFSALPNPCLQSAPAARGAKAAPNPEELPYDQKLVRGPHHRMVEIQREQARAGGGVERTTSRFVHLQPGLHYWEDNQWKESIERIEKDGAGAIAQYGQHKVRFAPNLNTAGAIDLEMSDGTRLRSQVLGLSYYDAETGKSVLLSEVKDSIGEIVPPHRLVYRDAFTDLKADLRYTWTKGAFEQDVIFKEHPPGPEVFGLNPETTRLEVLTEFVNPPAPEKTQKTIRTETDAQRRRAMLEPDSVDETLRFGSMTMTHGRAFRLEEEEMPDYWRASRVAAGLDVPPERKPHTAVAKRWQKFEGNRDFLVESVEFPTVRERLKKLPAAARPGRRGAAIRREIPEARVAGVSKPGQEILVASRPYDPTGFVVDYVIVTAIDNFTFYSGTTYLVNSSVNLYGTISIQGGAVIKYAGSDIIAFNGPISCQASAGNEAVFTTMHDNQFGETIPGSTGNPGAYQSSWGLFSTHGGAQYLTGLRIRYRNVGVQFLFGSPNWHTFRDSIVEYGLAAAQVQEANATLDNLTLCNVGTIYDGSGNYQVNVGSITYDCPGGGGGGGGGGGDDHGNSIGSATTLSPNSSVGGNIETAGDEDYFRISVSGSGTLTAYTTGSTDPYGYLLDSNGNTLAYNDDTVGLNFRVSYAVSSGTYYVRVRHYSSSGTGAYTLYAEFSDGGGGGGGDDHGNSTGTATSLSQNGSISGAIDYAGDEDFFQIQVTATGTLTAYSTGSTDPYGYLLDSNGNTLAYNDDTVGLNFRVSYAVSPGTYYVRVRHYSSGGTGAYTLYTELPCSDCDNDGLPDSWEQQYFGNLNQSGGDDYDSDGLTNAQEYTLGTHPANAFSNGTVKNDAQWDKDGDSISNAGEFNWSQTDPNNAYSLSGSYRDGQVKAGLHNNVSNGGILLQITGGAGGVTLAFNGTVAGQSYLVFTSEVVTGPWKLDRVLAGQTGQTTTAYPVSGPALFFVGGTTQDSDGDGLPDSYESFVTRTVFNADAGSLDGSEDPDADGIPHRAEYLFGSNPQIADNPLQFENLPIGSIVQGGLTMVTQIRPSTIVSLDDLGLHVHANGEPIEGFEFKVGADGVVHAEWVTGYTMNGSYVLQISAQVDSSLNMSGMPVSITVDNVIWFPDFQPDCGDAMRIAAKSKHVNGSWIMDIYDDQDVLIGQLDGTIDSDGWLVWPQENQALDPEPGWSLSLIDPATGQPFPSTFYVIEVATLPQFAPQGPPNPATAVAVKRVEPRWNIATKFAIAYQQAFNPNAAGGAGQVLVSMMQAIWSICEARNQPGVVNGTMQIPFELKTLQDWGQLGLDLKRNDVRNFFYFGHGGASSIGQKFPSTIGVKDLNQTILKNDNDGNAYGGPNLHAYRFVFLDGCRTAGGKLPDAFGIPRKQGMTAKTFTDQGMRFRAFMGWKSLDPVGAAQFPYLPHFNFVSGFFDSWAEPIIPPRSVRTAKDASQSVAGTGNTPWSKANDLIIYGYDGLLWHDTIP